jgi:hypothetical protein
LTQKKKNQTSFEGLLFGSVERQLDAVHLGGIFRFHLLDLVGSGKSFHL